MDHPSIRLNKFLAERLGISRREADDLIAGGQITVNGRTAVLGERIDCPVRGNNAGRRFSQVGNRKNHIFPIDARSEKLDSRSELRERSSATGIDILPKVCYNGKIVPFETEFLYLAFHKPVGYVCSRRTQGSAPTLYDLLPKKYHNLKTVGRLDKDSSGLILLTNDGDFAYQMTHPKFRKEKVYEVELGRPLAPLHQQMISDYGVDIGDGKSQFAVIRDENYDDRQHFTVVLSEGRNRQIRRTFAALGYTVTRLHRTGFGKYKLTSLKPGKYVIIEP